jgi:hypothetical protein
MKNFKSIIGLLACLAGTSVQAATKEQWRGRSMYQLSRVLPCLPASATDGTRTPFELE